ncbi:MFS transporter [Aristophania vespae]|uniref:MFS transporter n=1 Tax=Aristophania vespae TaxID=2697033 RepID=A0A6P1NEW6_9PROT|nr:MFS transporter [Aristophania vespae]QHI95998.1 MFS transporter [Aristophania vespae]UMM63758.1 putative MFS-type transporter YhhS [Aristophania vespae]
MSAATNTEETLEGSPTAKVLPVVLFNLLVYFIIGLPNAVIGAIFVHETLGFSTAIAGMTLSLQYLGTFGTRLVAGQLVDRYGPKKILSYGLLATTISGAIMCVAALIPTLMSLTGSTRYIALGLALLSRIFLGWGESWTATSVTTWNIRRVGRTHTSVAISWNGVTSYGGIALGVTVGKYLSHFMPNIGLLPVGIASAALAFGGLALLIPFYTGVKPLPVQKGKQMSFFHALRKVLPYGAGLAAGSFAFGTISSFLALYFSANEWTHIGRAFGIFSAVFILGRLLFASQIDKRGGMLVAFISLVVSALAMAIFCAFHTELGATIGAALTGAGFSLLFPALGTMAVKTGGAEYSGILLAAYSVFTDLTIFVVGPLMGAIQVKAGWNAMFGVVGLLCLSGIALSTLLSRLPGSGIQPETKA